jgi:hypothetical protein
MAEGNPNRPVENPDNENQDPNHQGQRSFIRVTRFYSDLFEPGTPDISRLNPVAGDNGSAASSVHSRESESPRTKHSRRTRPSLPPPVIYSHHINDLANSFSIPVEDISHEYHWHTPEYPVSRTISRASSIQGNSDLLSSSTLSSPRTIDVASVNSSSSSSGWISSPELEQHFRCPICHHIMTNPAAYSIHIYRLHRR